jgi:HK97 family phage prohead protease
VTAAPSYYLEPGPARVPSWFMGSRTEYEEWLVVQELRRFQTVLEPVRFEQNADGDIVEGRAMPYNEWTTINSPSEGRFLERFAPTAFASQVREGFGAVRVMFEHGEDKLLGRQIVAKLSSLTDLPDGLYFRAELLRGLPELVVAGIRANLYGTSVRFSPVETARERLPQRSAHNPLRLPESTILEARLREVSLVAFPAYRNATAQIVHATE